MHDALAESDELALPFIKTILPITSHIYFIELYHNMFLNKELSIELKNELVWRYITVLSKNPRVFLKDHSQHVLNLYVAAVNKPAISDQKVMQEMLTELDSLYGLLAIDMLDDKEK